MKRLVKLAMLVATSLAVATTVARAESIPLKPEGGTFVVPVLINDKITLDFTLDSGAAEVSIPLDVFSTLQRTHTISDSDLLPSATYELADGSVRRQIRFRIRSLKVGSLEFHDIVGSVAPLRGDLLLGQSFLLRLSNWSVNNELHVLLINEGIAGVPTTTQVQVNQLQAPQTPKPQSPGAAYQGKPANPILLKATSCISGHAPVEAQVECVSDAVKSTCAPNNSTKECRILESLDEQASAVLTAYRAGKLDIGNAERKLLDIALPIELGQ